MKYLRYYPLVFQFLLFLLMVFTMLSLGYLCLETILPKAVGVHLLDLTQITEKSSPDLIHISLLVQAVMSALIFLVPTLIFSYLAHPQVTQYLGLKLPKNSLHLLLGILIMLGAMPVLMLIQSLMSHIDFGPEVKKGQEAGEVLQRAYLTMNNYGDFIRSFFVIAIIPALGEELFFRGALMRFIYKFRMSKVFAIVFTALTFAYIHANYYGMPSIFLAGVLLAVIYNLTSSLWCGIAAHCFFNGMQVILTYMGNNNPHLASAVNDDKIQWWLVLAGLAVFSASFFALWKTRNTLPANWADDFDEPPSLTTGGEYSIFDK